MVTTPEWQAAHGALYKAAYMMPVFLNFRMRIYAGSGTSINHATVSSTDTSIISTTDTSVSSTDTSIISTTDTFITRFVLSEVSCIMAGLGAYPVSSR